MTLTMAMLLLGSLMVYCGVKGYSLMHALRGEQVST